MKILHIFEMWLSSWLQWVHSDCCITFLEKKKPFDARNQTDFIVWNVYVTVTSSMKSHFSRMGCNHWKFFLQYCIQTAQQSSVEKKAKFNKIPFDHRIESTVSNDLWVYIQYPYLVCLWIGRRNRMIFIKFDRYKYSLDSWI